jgi:hypothetical protein
MGEMRRQQPFRRFSFRLSAVKWCHKADAVRSQLRRTMRAVKKPKVLLINLNEKI